MALDADAKREMEFRKQERLAILIEGDRQATKMEYQIAVLEAEAFRKTVEQPEPMELF